MPADAITAENPLTGPAFDRFYETSIKPELEKREVERQAGVKQFYALLAIGGMVVVLESGFTRAASHGGNFIPDIRLVAVTMFIAAALGYFPLSAVRSKVKLGIITAFCGPLGLRYHSSGEPTRFDAYQAFKLINKPDDSHFEDHFEGVRNSCSFELCEARLTKGSGKSREVIFSGQLFRVAFPHRFLGETVVLRDSGWFNRFDCPPHMAKVGLEDPHFEKIFEVFGTDQVEARAILTPAFMQRLVDLESAYGGSHMRYAFTDGDLLIAIEASDKFEIGGMFSTLVDRKRVEAIAHDIGAVFQLIDSFVAA